MNIHILCWCFKITKLQNYKITKLLWSRWCLLHDNLSTSLANFFSIFQK